MDYMNIGRSFSILHRRSQLFVTAACEHLKLSYSEYVMLMRIFASEGLSQEELSSTLFLDKAVVTRTISLLEQKGMVYREKDARDQRMKRLYPTEQAKEEREYLEGIIYAWVDYLQQGMPREEAEAIAKGFLMASERASQANIPELVRRMGKREADSLEE